MSEPIDNIQNHAEKPKACTKRVYQITASDVPLSCPPQGDRVWDAHPRVYLPIEELGEVVCPYCETKYILKQVNM